MITCCQVCSHIEFKSSLCCFFFLRPYMGRHANNLLMIMVSLWLWLVSSHAGRQHQLKWINKQVLSNSSIYYVLNRCFLVLRHTQGISSGLPHYQKMSSQVHVSKPPKCQKTIHWQLQAWKLMYGWTNCEGFAYSLGMVMVLPKTLGDINHNTCILWSIT